MKKIFIAFTAIIGITAHTYAAPSGMDWRNERRPTDTMLQQFDTLKANQRDLDTMSRILRGKVNATNGILKSPTINNGTSIGTDIKAALAAVGPAGAISRTLSDFFSDVLDVRDFGAFCDGIHNDTVAVQFALNAATSPLRLGSTLRFHGRCIVNSAVSATISSSAGLRIEGEGAEIISHGNDVFKFSKAVASGNALFIRDLRFTNAKSTPSGTMITIDGSQNGVGSSQNDHLESLDFYNPGIGILLVGAANYYIANINDMVTTPGASYGLILNGPKIGTSQYFTTNGTIDGWFQAAGRFLTISGGIQGLNITNVRQLVGNDWAIYEQSGVAVEVINITNSYFEANNGGISLPDAFSINITGNTFDTSATIRSPTWQAIVTGKNNEVISNNQIFDARETTSPLISVQGMGNTITGNTLFGLSKTSACIALNTDGGLDANGAYSVISNNACWQAAGINITGAHTSNVTGSGNVFTKDGLEQTATFGPIKTSANIDLDGSSLTFFDTVSKGISLHYDDAVFNKAGALVTVSVNGKSGSLFLDGHIGVSGGSHVCLNYECSRYIYEDVGSSKIKVANTTNGDVFSIDDKGNIIAKGTVTQNGVP
ncbi:hypothetical protein [Gluconobacter roseus]|uniref:Right handed beta helix domain-containing protein n=1 Tax=Gluconobacter roseus NBRC 3990 TaxID=1307950 RepID=A0A4Y3M413_9PROT|nr:hypothetical protein [Gluconobacter roseus]KXV43942.1 hypothetical protein AD943_05785 [Gluconobacter roseus]GBR48232.1 hypothetical protein AA3990_2046 [Gluconobacter roseus NBRC 3990]GEB03365.1 hypothetical protein GRO01_09410 [Gluconobacter roseus NBRC 3990]GLP93823.1 hypothetical protein GCM10007871_18010 [Gluconobacter roseus NBRC 3990]